MASFAAVGVSRVSFLKASCLDFNGCRSCCSLPPSSEPSSTHWAAGLKSTSRRSIVCSAVQESSAPTVSAETKEAKPVEKEAPPPKPKPAAKAPVKPLPAMMEEDVLPALRSIIEAQEDISDLELSFQNNRLDGSFKKKNYPYSFWAFFPSGTLTGPKGFSLSSYGSEASTVEPFLIDEKKITARHVVFWVEKRLAAQGIIPVWNEDEE